MKNGRPAIQGTCPTAAPRSSRSGSSRASTPFTHARGPTHACPATSRYRRDAVSDLVEQASSKYWGLFARSRVSRDRAKKVTLTRGALGNRAYSVAPSTAHSTTRRPGTPEPGARRRCVRAALSPREAALGKDADRLAGAQRLDRLLERASASPAPRLIGIWPDARRGSGPAGDAPEAARARKRSLRLGLIASATRIGSHWLSWLGTTSRGPSAGTSSSPSTRRRPHQAAGRSSAARGRRARQNRIAAARLRSRLGSPEATQRSTSPPRTPT